VEAKVMIDETKPHVLWVDDDDPDRFVYERYLLERDGWKVTWARDVAEAADKLSHEKFDAVILDQMIAGSGVEEQFVIWAGCRLLRWLRGTDPPDSQRREDTPWPALHRLAPNDANKHLPVAILSAYHDADVLRATQGASEQDRKALFLGKPVKEAELLGFLHKVRPTQKSS
jgi:CheY-like chemotaxis protein